MSKRVHIFLIFALAALPLTGCGVATQNIPVSSNPSGAQVFADGMQTCTTPCSVELEKTQAHILTLKKPGYRQADVQISQKYDTGGVTRDAVQSGMSSSSMGSSVEGSIAGALLSAEQDEASGNAYVLTPSSVVVTLVPDCKTGTAQPQQGTVQTTEPATIGSAIEKDPVGVGEEVLKEAAVAAPTIGTEKEISHHSHTSTHHNSDGSMSQHSSSSSVSVGVHVNPVEAGLDALEFLEGAEKKEADTTK
ncbi:PEGA domain-containing protein [Pseudodesulfovibrio sp. JC047]|uniref:PEGA domain-containing protein n=1 Tax=Pseudodesulfovibrio sp. JC047 TaxID=2683199 RepID=UPI0013D85DB4|nr:PEGA domain-containing protein [Pseudodesulfovibrio sp. JC047]NDV20208.1 PEGA domain-containing protein [Pseudodesulfovibrio sp. JC047]